MFNHRLWGDADGMHEQSLQEPAPPASDQSSAEKEKSNTTGSPADKNVSETGRHQTKKAMTAENRAQIEQLRQIAAWRILKGNRIK